MTRKYLRLFTISFVSLFLEIACIRWFNSNVIMLSYFSNFVLLACFLGLGAGIFLANSKKDYLVFFPALFLVLCFIFWKVLIRITIKSDISIYFTDFGLSKGVPLYHANAVWFLPCVFFLTTIVFITIGQEVGRAFSDIKPLTAYFINICGSIFGVGLFTLISFIRTSPVIWFLIAFICLWPYLSKKRFFAVNIMVLLLSIVLVRLISQGATFSPYYRIDTFGVTVIVNGIPHQGMMDVKKNPNNVYKLPYELVKKPAKVLILGAGTGSDTAEAIENGAGKIDAVEIDPVIIKIGRKHPNKPYQNDKVKVYNEDARTFLKTTNEKYDLIIFGLVDSLTVFSQFSSLRLESFVFTKDCFQDVKKHLTDNGVVVLYNGFRKVWIIERISKMLEEVFGLKSVIYDEPSEDHFAVIFNGPGIGKIKIPKTMEIFPGKKDPVQELAGSGLKSATDDWPFLYMQKPSIPLHYMLSIVMILIFAGLIVYSASDIAFGLNNHFFFLGCGFMLLETSAIIRMALLFGSTWIVNSIVIISVLVMTLLSVLFTGKVAPKSSKQFYVYLFVCILANIFIPLKLFLIFPEYVKMILSVLLLFLPIFFSGVVFATSFSKTENVPAALGSNLVGCMFGGCLEYISLKYGYGSLMILLLGIYLVSIKNFWWKLSFKKLR